MIRIEQLLGLSLCCGLGATSVVADDSDLLKKTALTQLNASSEPVRKDSVEPEFVVLQCVFAEARGDLEKALKNCRFTEVNPGTRYVATLPAKSSEVAVTTKDDQTGDSAAGRDLTSAMKPRPGQFKAIENVISIIENTANLFIISRPSIRSIMNQPSELFVGSKQKSIPYLVKLSPTTFELRQVKDPELGWGGHFLFQPGPDSESFSASQMKIYLKSLDGRETIPELAGVGVVGAPIISSRVLETSLSIPDSNTVNALLLPAPPNRKLVLFVYGCRIHPDPKPAPVESTTDQNEPRDKITTQPETE